MIESFIESWALFRDAYMTGWLVAVSLAIIGVWVVAKDQIFLGAAVSQASALGIAATTCVTGALVASHAHHHHHGTHETDVDAIAAVAAIAFAVAAALLTTRGGKRGGETSEALTGWVFLLSASGSIVLVAHSPHGLEEVKRLHTSSIIGADVPDVLCFAAFLGITIAMVCWAPRRLLLLALDREMAEAVGMRTTAWRLGLLAWLGLGLGLAIRTTGVLYAFGCLVLPALVAKNLCREARSLFWAAPLLGLAASTCGFLLANHYDYPPAQLTVALMCVLLPASWLARGIRFHLGKNAN